MKSAPVNQGDTARQRPFFGRRYILRKQWAAEDSNLEPFHGV